LQLPRRPPSRDPRVEAVDCWCGGGGDEEAGDWRGERAGVGEDEEVGVGARKRMRTGTGHQMQI
jgi:hypothetical protein